MIDRSVIKEVQKKERTLQLPRRSAVKPVLIYAGEISSEAEEEINNYFYRVINWEKLMG